MCYSLQSSLYTFLFSFLVALYLYSTNIPIHQTNGLILLSFIFMQLNDTIIHYSINHSLENLNYYTSKYLTTLILSLEIPLIYYFVYLLTGKRNILLEIIFGIIILYGFVYGINSCQDISIKKPDGYILWCQNTIQPLFKFIFLIGLLLAMWYYPNNIYKLLFYIIVISTFAFNYNNQTFGSRWCHHANLLSILLLLIYFIKG
jgi:hypothetical protein